MNFVKSAILSVAILSATNAFADDNVLRVATEPSFAPFEFTDNKANIIGYDVDIIKAIGEAEGFDVQVVNMPFDSLIPGVLTAQLDGAIAGISITEERAKQVSFSDPYYKSGISAIVRKADAKKYTTLDSLKNSRLCAQIGTTGASYGKELSGNVGTYNTVPEAFMELKNKGCEAVVNDRPVNLYFLQTKKDDSYVEVKDLANGEEYGIVVSKKNPEVLKKLNDGLKKIRENGTFAKIHEKWFLVKE